MPGRLLELHVENFGSLRDVTIPLGPLTVLVGPNGVGKSNVLKVFDFLAAIIRTDLQPALDERGGFDEVAFWGGEKPPTSMAIRLTADWTTHASAKAPDEYSLTIRRRARDTHQAQGVEPFLPGIHGGHPRLEGSPPARSLTPALPRGRLAASAPPRNYAHLSL